MRLLSPLPLQHVFRLLKRQEIITKIATVAIAPEANARTGRMQKFIEAEMVFPRRDFLFLMSEEDFNSVVDVNHLNLVRF